MLKKEKRVWLPHEVERLVSLRKQGFTFAEIAADVKHPGPSCASKYYEAVGIHASYSSRKRALISEVQRSAQASAAPRSLTASVCGDPPPGRSALDRTQPPRRAGISLAGRS